MPKTIAEHDKVINTTGREGYAAQFAVYDAKRRNEAALANNPAFFKSAAHTRRIEVVKRLVQKFFGTDKGMYVSHREGSSGRQPFTSVKIANPKFPKGARAELAAFSQRIRALGNIEIVFSAQTKSYIYRIS